MGNLDWQTAERAATVDTSGPLPFEVRTLEYIPAESRAQYVRDMTGGFRLGWVESGSPDVARFAEQIAAGRMAVMKPGETPVDVAAREAVHAQMQKETQAEIARLEAKQRDEMIAAAKRRGEQEAERIRLETERVIREYGIAAPPQTVSAA
jgi:hypothetical protein